MSCPVGYPVASIRVQRDTCPQAVFGALRPVTDEPFCSSSLLRAGEGNKE